LAVVDKLYKFVNLQPVLSSLLAIPRWLQKRVQYTLKPYL